MCKTIYISLSGQSKQTLTRTEYFFMIYPSPQGYIDCPKVAAGVKGVKTLTFLLVNRFSCVIPHFIRYNKAKTMQK